MYHPLENQETMESVLKKSSKLKRPRIPQDLIDDILTRLPLKSVFRFKAVSKLWNSTISNPTFHGMHDPVTRIFTVVETNPLLFQSVDEKGNVDKFRAPSWCKFERKGKNRIITSNSCNGMLLLCLDTRIFLVNPTIHYIERVLTLDERFDSRHISNFDSTEMGFCYDESIDDYKAVIFHRNLDTVLVASLKEKVWIPLQRPMACSYMSPGLLVNDRLHATATVRSVFGAGNVIVYFNPVNSDFEGVPGPQPTSGVVRDNIVSLGVLDGCLCIARKIGLRDIEVLKMKEYGNADSWSTMFVLPDFEMSSYHFWFKLFLETENGDILFSYQQIIWKYNLANKSLTKFRNYNPMVVPVTFAENLCSPNGSSVMSKYMRISDACFNCGAVGHIERDCSRARKSRSSGAQIGSSDWCYNCGKHGHFTSDCNNY